VPVIVWCVIGLLWSLPFPHTLAASRAVNWASLAVLAALAYYALLSVPLALGVAPILFGMLWSVDQLGSSRLNAPLWSLCAALFVLAWIGQFIGHAVEGKRPSFFKDLQFLLIGPLWLLADLYRRLGARL
jgi:uncharacterized membrane protein YGL010W